VDLHHTVEDVGICLGKAFHEALGEKRGIVRFGTAYVPMDEALAAVHLDISGRPYFSYNVPLAKTKVGNFDLDLLKIFLPSPKRDVNPREPPLRRERPPHRERSSAARLRWRPAPEPAGPGDPRRRKARW
jgi:hypothetical protein